MTGHSSKADRATMSAVARRTRRQLLVGGTGAVAAALTAEALARPAPAAAANGDNVILGQDNSETHYTSITNSTDADTALECIAVGSGIGMLGSSDSGAGVAGISGAAAVGSNSHNGVLGASSDGDGVAGFNFSGQGRGVYGQSGSTGPAFGSISNGYGANPQVAAAHAATLPRRSAGLSVRLPGLWLRTPIASSATMAPAARLGRQRGRRIRRLRSSSRS